MATIGVAEEIEDFAEIGFVDGAVAEAELESVWVGRYEIALITRVNQPSVEFFLDRLQGNRMIKEGKLALGVPEDADEGTVAKALRRLVSIAAGES